MNVVIAALLIIVIVNSCAASFAAPSNNTIQNAQFLIGQKKYKEAISQLNALIKYNPKNALAYIEDITKIISLAPDICTKAYWYAERGRINIDQKQYEQAIQDLSTAIALDPCSEVYASRADAYSQQGQYSKALVDLNSAIEISQRLSEPITWDSYYYQRANIYNKLEQYEEAIQDYTQAIAIYPDRYEAYQKRGETYAKLGEFSLAYRDWTEGVHLESTVPRLEGATHVIGTEMRLLEW